MDFPPKVLVNAVPPRIVHLWNRSGVWRSVTFLGLGSLWDALTLTRIDRWSDQAFLLGYQVLFAASLVLDLRWRASGVGPRWLHRYPNVLRYVSQFALGGLLSVYCVYYFRGAASVRALVYGLFLIVLLFGNEFFIDRVRAGEARLAVLAFALFNGLVFALPLATGWLLPAWISAVVALTLAEGARRLSNPKNARADARLMPSRWALWPAGLVLAVVLVLVRFDVLPPLPLSLQRVGVYRDVERVSDGVALTYEEQWGPFPWRYDRTLHWQQGEWAWCFTAVFAPRGMDLTVVHHWDQYDAELGWVPRDQMPLQVKGGRDGGFRTWSRKRHLEAGEWRVRITGPGGRELGRIHVDVVEGPPVRELRRRLVE